MGRGEKWECECVCVCGRGSKTRDVLPPNTHLPSSLWISEYAHFLILKLFYSIYSPWCRFSLSLLHYYRSCHKIMQTKIRTRDTSDTCTMYIFKFMFIYLQHTTHNTRLRVFFLSLFIVSCFHWPQKYYVLLTSRNLIFSLFSLKSFQESPLNETLNGE